MSVKRAKLARSVPFAELRSPLPSAQLLFVPADPSPTCLGRVCIDASRASLLQTITWSMGHKGVLNGASGSSVISVGYVTEPVLRKGEATSRQSKVPKLL